LPASLRSAGAPLNWVVRPHPKWASSQWKEAPQSNGQRCAWSAAQCQRCPPRRMRAE
jgi:hypothetical protein